jgi:hypothetical protein
MKQPMARKFYYSTKENADFLKEGHIAFWIMSPWRELLWTPVFTLGRGLMALCRKN